MEVKNSTQAEAFELRAGWANQEAVQQNFNYALQKVVEYVRAKIPVIIFGPPGTGKTYIIEKVKEALANDGIMGNYDLVQFHKKFSYEDFIEGFSPDEKGLLQKKDGTFKSFCKNGNKESDKINLFVIDEINRAELSTTLGEVLYLLEDRHNRVATTTHFSESFSIPQNLALLGTMNTADRNISSIDFAIRRRFRFVPLFPDYAVLKELLVLGGWNEKDLGIEVDVYCKAAEIINHRIGKTPIMGRHMQLGHMMFVPSHSTRIEAKQIVEQFTYVILPQIEAYCGFGNELIIGEILTTDIANKYLNARQITYDDILASVKDIANSKENVAKV